MGGIGVAAAATFAGRTAPRATAAPAVDWEALRANLGGQLFLPGEPGFDTARLPFNKLYDSNIPAAVARCASVADVQACLDAAGTRVPLAARSGGHSYAGYSVPPDGLVVDVADLSAVDVQGDLVTVGAGARIGDVYTAVAGAGRALPGGTCSSVGVSGLTLGGGIGVLTRKYGLTCDHLTAAEVVTADGHVRTASPGSEPDLFWALRGGGGGNFGIVTSMTFRTDPAPGVTVFSLPFGTGAPAAVLGAWQSWIAAAPPEMWANVLLFGGPQPEIRIGGCFVGGAPEATALLDDLVRRAGVEVPDRMVRETTYLEAMRHFGTDGSRGAYVASSRIIGAPADPDAVVELSRKHPGSLLIIDPLGGAVSEVDSTATAFPHRDALAAVQVYADTTVEDEPATRAMVHEMVTALEGMGVGNGYVNYIDPDLPNWQQAYYGPNLARLQGVSRTFDPQGVFRFPQSV
ncbi:FAD-binding oxidoreductase [Saccharopolyspora taberi]|uniref:FAD-binding oxidoreductase n=1 Tax=Saccharopolyspora taberi TaxID=60895 RepID=A0ABN3VE16_9PSEU